jgi:hypothetical protein
VADGFSISLDDRAVLAALERLGPAAETRQKAAAKLTAEAIQRSAQSRVAHLTGFTAKNIVVRESTTVKGYVVTMGDVVSETETARRRSLGMKSAKSKYHQEKHTGLWLEFGTVQGRPGSHTSAPRPFLFPASELERGPHARRVREAVSAAQADVGLGG